MQLDFAIIEHFKVLPTDERFRSLNFFQKLMLSSIIGKKFEEYATIIDQVVKRVTFYINPDVYKMEQDHIDGKAAPNERVNQEFMQHSLSAMATGKPEVSPLMQAALNKLGELKRQKPKLHTLRIPTDEGNPDEVLG